MSFGYCQTCSRKRVMSTLIDQKPCFTCGSDNFGWNPRPHRFDSTVLTPSDIEFLRVQGIKPEPEKR